MFERTAFDYDDLWTKYSRVHIRERDSIEQSTKTGKTGQVHIDFSEGISERERRTHVKSVQYLKNATAGAAASLAEYTLGKERFGEKSNGADGELADGCGRADSALYAGGQDARQGSFA